VRPTIARWIGDADAAQYLERFGSGQEDLVFAYIRERADDYYVALVGELFDRVRRGYTARSHWAVLGNALAQFSESVRAGSLGNVGVSANEALLMAAAAFYSGGYPASAYITIRQGTTYDVSKAHLSCFDLLARPVALRSELMAYMVRALEVGDLEGIDAAVNGVEQEARTALELGPEEWLPARLLEQLAKRFRGTNVRAVLPDGSAEFWTPLVSSLLQRTPPVWDFFPSQIEAVEKGLLTRNESFALQMPTGAGKTTLCETLLFWHLQRHPEEVAVLLVPYRSLASELRFTLVKEFNRLGISARCAYGGTVPSGDEVRLLDDTRLLVATPESLSGLLSADPAFFNRISLAVCDEGHLLDGGGRGIGLELLLARMASREVGAPRFVFISAIVPNVEEINLWLGGTADTVVRSDYRPALAEFAVLRSEGQGAGSPVSLQMHPHEPIPIQHSIPGFLQRDDFQFRSVETGRLRTFPFSSIKTRAVAAARKALPLGAVAIFAANKRGDQGAVGLAEELLNQLRNPLPLAEPIQFSNAERLMRVHEYVAREYGAAWVGARSISAGAVLHHGDIPQETREVFESSLRSGDARLAICTNTLAEGVNLPIRTLVLYSVKRRKSDGRTVNLLLRDIKNLVGRAGRAGTTTKGLVICANPDQWNLVEPVALQRSGERVAGSLQKLVRELSMSLAFSGVPLANATLEADPQYHTLIDGIDSTLVDLATEELGLDELVAVSTRLAEQTFAYQQLDARPREVLQRVFGIRARHIHGLAAAGRLSWIRETGSRARILNAVETRLLPAMPDWGAVDGPLSPALLHSLVDWAWEQAEVQEAVREAYRLDNGPIPEATRESFARLVTAWISGRRFLEIADAAGLQLDQTLAVHAKAVTFALQTAIEQGTALLAKLLNEQGTEPASSVMRFPEHLRFGVPTTAACTLITAGLRHRLAAVVLGDEEAVRAIEWAGAIGVVAAARGLIRADEARYRDRFGSLVYDNTSADLDAAVRSPG
jgi:hypothetical protein